MRKFLLIILWSVLLGATAFADQYYVFIDKIGVVENGREGGQTEKGDVVGIYPFTKQYQPTKSEKERYQIIIADLTEAEVNNLLAPVKVLTGKNVDGQDMFITEKARAVKIDYEKLNLSTQEENVVVSEINKNIIDKSVAVPVE